VNRCLGELETHLTAGGWEIRRIRGFEQRKLRTTELRKLGGYEVERNLLIEIEKLRTLEIRKLGG
jgi:hypothetical protein